MHFVAPDPVKLSNHSYYLPRNNAADKTNVTAFPEYFQMLAGSPGLRTYSSVRELHLTWRDLTNSPLTIKSSDAQQAIGWDCLGGDGRQPPFPTTNCADGLRQEASRAGWWRRTLLNPSILL